MKTSVRYKELKVRLNELRKYMLPNIFSDIGDYNERLQDRARGYRLLAHAEIESFLEDISRDAVTNATDKWLQDKKPSVTLISLLACYHSGWSVSDETRNNDIMQMAKSRNKVKQSTIEIVEKAKKQFINKVKDNNGVKESNLKTLFIPTGIDIEDLDQTWITNLDTFGKNRGSIAHTSKKKTSTPINPKDEFETITKLLAGLEGLDKIVLKI
ncbi:MAG: HEPN domain-containing protein [Colwellia sp.]|jgi:hypothetical protein